jgi:hypothetical protein
MLGTVHITTRASKVRLHDVLAIGLSNKLGNALAGRHSLGGMVNFRAGVTAGHASSEQTERQNGNKQTNHKKSPAR